MHSVTGFLYNRYECVSPEVGQLPQAQQPWRHAGRERGATFVQVQARGPGWQPPPAAAPARPTAHQHQVLPALAQMRAHLHLYTHFITVPH